MWKRYVAIGVTGGLLAFSAVAPVGAVGDGVEQILANDNSRRAGVKRDNVVTVRLRAASGQWQPEGVAGPALIVDAFGEDGAALTVPAPLVRVTEGDTVVVSIRNELKASLKLHGLCSRDGGTVCAPVDVPAGDSREVRFESGRAGTYHYWASSIGAPIPFRELAGALVVDPPGTSWSATDRDRIMVITEWTNLTAEQLGEILAAKDVGAAFFARHPKVTFVINGLSWPATERFVYRRGETVRWRVVNLSSQIHPMHLHGFYFTVTHTGDGLQDKAMGDGHGQRVVTQVMPSGGTMSLEWTPDREGNWLFHCHVMHHVSLERRLTSEPSSPQHHSSSSHHSAAASGAPFSDASLGMAGMVLGVTVLPSSDTRQPMAHRMAAKPRKLTMVIGRSPTPNGQTSAGFAVLANGASTADASVTSPGPPLVLRRNEPVEITLVNRLDEPTSIHWHGLEIGSIYDGVHGWSGARGSVAPMIEPGASFVVRMMPPRAGTFIYHTHLHDYRQLSSGLYGPLIVTERDESYDPASDHVVVLGRRDATEASGILEDPATVVVNGQRDPRWEWPAGTRHRIRLVNIAPDDIFDVSLRAADTPVFWTPLTKDGMPVPSTSTSAVPARQRIAVGETYDFEVNVPGKPSMLKLEVRSLSGKWQAEGRVDVK